MTCTPGLDLVQPYIRRGSYSYQGILNVFWVLLSNRVLKNISKLTNLHWLIIFSFCAIFVLSTLISSTKLADSDVKDIFATNYCGFSFRTTDSLPLDAYMFISIFAYLSECNSQPQLCAGNIYVTAVQNLFFAFILIFWLSQNTKQQISAHSSANSSPNQNLNLFNRASKQGCVVCYLSRPPAGKHC